MNVKAYNPDQMIGDLSGKVIFITGGTSGIGLQTIVALAKHNPRQIVFTGRNVKSAEKVISQTGADKVSFIPCDMNSLDSVRRAAETFSRGYDRLDIMLANAGINATPEGAKLTEEGYEPMWGVNHLAHSLLIRLLLPLMERTSRTAGADVRIILLSSTLHSITPEGGIDYPNLTSFKSYGAGRTDLKRYGRSKLANLLYARELSDRYPSILAVSLHPGLVRTEMYHAMHPVVKAMGSLIGTFVPSFNSIEPVQGAYNSLWTATAARDGVKRGEYYDPVGKVGVKSRFVNKKTSKELWEYTENELARWL